MRKSVVVGLAKIAEGSPFAAIGASKGGRATVPALAGYHLATFVVTALIGVGMGATILNHPMVAKSLAAIGSLYVL